MSAAPIRLVDDYQAKYIKFNGREPRTLEELAIARANLEHSNRLREIKTMAKKLVLLQEHLQPLAARGIKLSNRHMGPWDDGKVLNIWTSTFEHHDDALLAALLDIGFKEVERKDHFGRTDNVTLKHGRALLVRLEVSKLSGSAS